MKPSVSVVVPAWNEEDCIEDTIDALLNQTYPIKILIVDDASDDSTAILSIMKGVEVVTAPKQGSKSRALNYVLDKIETDLFVCVDADTVLSLDAIEKMVEAFEDPKTMVASGMVHSKSSDNYWQSARSTEYVSMQKIVKSAQNKWKMVLVASGCFFGVRANYLKEKGGFPDRTLAEDMDLTWMAVEDGYDVSYVEDAKCWVDDPYNYYTYTKQVERWFRGFFQNIQIRNFSLFKNRFKLGIVVYAYSLLNVISLPIMIYTIYTNPFGVLHFLSIGFAIICAYYFIYGKESLFGSIKSTFNFLSCSFLNQYLFLKSAYLELIKGDKLSVWIKGH